MAALQAVDAAWAEFEAVFSEEDSPAAGPVPGTESLASGSSAMTGRTGMEAVDTAWVQYAGAILDEEKRAENEVRRLRQLLAKTAEDLEFAEQRLAAQRGKERAVCLLVRRLSTMVRVSSCFHHWSRLSLGSAVRTAQSALIDRQSSGNDAPGWPCLTHAKWVVHKKVLLELQESQQTIAMLEESNADLFSQVIETNSLKMHLEQSQEEVRNYRQELQTLRAEHAELLAKCADPCNNELLGMQRPALDWSEEANGFARRRMGELHSELLPASKSDIEMPHWNGLCEDLLPSLYMQALALCVQLDAKCTLMTHAKRHLQLQEKLGGETRRSAHQRPAIAQPSAPVVNRVRVTDDVVALCEPSNACSPVLWNEKAQNTVGREHKRAAEVARRVAALKRQLKQQGLELSLSHLKGCTYLLGSRKLVLALNGETLLVRAGGGWSDLKEYLERFNIEEQKKLFPSNEKAGPTNARPIYGENSPTAWKHLLRNTNNTNRSQQGTRKKQPRPAWQLGNVDFR